jgi:hypothetical protein
MTPEKAEQMRLNKFIRIVATEVAVMAMPELNDPFETAYCNAKKSGKWESWPWLIGRERSSPGGMIAYFSPGDTSLEYRENVREVAKLIADTAASRGECEFMVRRVKSGKVKIVVYGDAK